MKTREEEGEREDRESTVPGRSAFLQFVHYFIHLQEFANVTVVLAREKNVSAESEGGSGPGKGWHWERQAWQALHQLGLSMRGK